MLATYYTNYYLLPKYLFKRNYIPFIGHSLLILGIIVYLVQLVIFDNFIFNADASSNEIPKNFVFVLVLVYLVVGFVGFAKLVSYNARTLAVNKQLENENLENSLKLKEQELQYLKKQIHPHFLFNTLNTIYSFALRKSERTPEIILKLSNLLDYILYQVQKPVVPLTEEIAHLEEYVSLEKIRFGDSLNVEFVSEGIDHEVSIPPMLFIPLVENAFKHGSIVDGNLTINITIKYNAGALSCSVYNSIKDSKPQHNNGLGLSTIERRLKLLYKDQYQLQIDSTENYFSILLLIQNILIPNETTL
jgi:LytS/YehU family sensor histidine kinase